jgi:D-alanyl-lipoteichoic acid acyltransferase DltB (MBOAT superfamily)
MITFLVSGFWHGTGLTFLVWGAMHGIFQILEGLIFKRKTETMSFSTRLFRMALTFALVSIAWVFFRSYGVREALRILFRAVMPGQAGILFTERLYTMAMDARNLRIFMIAMILLVCADVRQYRHGDLMERFLSQHIVLRILIVWVILFFVILSVNLSGTEFIYMQF